MPGDDFHSALQSPVVTPIKQRYDPRTMFKEIAKLAFPMSFTRLVQVIPTFVALIMLSVLGHHIVAACALIATTRVVFSVIPMGFLFAIGVVSSRFEGEKKPEDNGAMLQQGVLLALLLSAPIIICYWFAVPILTWLHQPMVLMPFIQAFFKPFILSVIPMMTLTALQQFLFGLRLQRIVLFVSTINVLVLIAGTYALGLGHFGFAKMGVAGFAWAFDISQWFIFAIYLVILMMAKRFKPYRLFQLRLRQNWHLLKQLLHIGWPMFVQVATELGAFFVLTVMIGWLGLVPLAAQQVVSQIAFIVIVPIFGVSEAASILVSHAYGEKKYTTLGQMTSSTVYFGLILAFFVAACLAIFPEQIAGLYLHGDSVAVKATQHLLRWLFLLTAGYLVFDTIRNVYIGALRGLFDTRYAMMIAVLIIWGMEVPLAALFGFVFHWGIIGIYLGTLIAFSMGAWLMKQRWRQRLQRCDQGGVA